jgi:plasmid stabilization system protein ParE
MAAARKELRRAVGRYDAQLSGLGDDFASEVARSVQEIAERPEQGSPHTAGTRRVLTRRFPYSIIYQVQGQQVVVIAVAHHRRRPDYWLRRL